jgi:hypothetical protein
MSTTIRISAALGTALILGGAFPGAAGSSPDAATASADDIDPDGLKRRGDGSIDDDQSARLSHKTELPEAEEQTRLRERTRRRLAADGSVLRERSERRERLERSGRSERVEREERAVRAERPERPERVERPERPERAERAERPERPKRPERSSRSGR